MHNCRRAVVTPVSARTVVRRSSTRKALKRTKQLLLWFFYSKPILEIGFGQERSCRRAAAAVVRVIQEEMQKTIRNNEDFYEEQRGKVKRKWQVFSIVMKEVFPRRNKTKEREMAAGGQRQWSSAVKHKDSWNRDCRTSLGRSRRHRELCKWATYHGGNL